MTDFQPLTPVEPVWPRKPLGERRDPRPPTQRRRDNESADRDEQPSPRHEREPDSGPPTLPGHIVDDYA